MTARVFDNTVLLPYEITLFSNPCKVDEKVERFYYLMKLHYSQTNLTISLLLLQFYYLMKLHYSQTPASRKQGRRVVLLPYEITLFSNILHVAIVLAGVLLPYEITLFSNNKLLKHFVFDVLLPYEITLFSNL